jgi:hypothetical protein
VELETGSARHVFRQPVAVSSGFSSTGSNAKSDVSFQYISVFPYDNRSQSFQRIAHIVADRSRLICRNRAGHFKTGRAHRPRRITSLTFRLLAFVKSASSRAMHHRQRKLQTFDDVVRVLGGPGKVGALCEGQDSAAVCNWRRRRGRFPTKYYPIMIEALAEQRATAPDHLWGFVEKKKNSAHAA